MLFASLITTEETTAMFHIDTIDDLHWKTDRQAASLI